MSSKKKTNGGASPSKRSSRKAATPPESDEGDSKEGDPLMYTEAQARTMFGSPKKSRIQVNITPGNGVYIWMRKGEGSKCGLTKEALKS
jgi:hypothetical protein